MSDAFSSAFSTSFGNTNLVRDVRNPCNSCPSSEVPLQSQDEGTGDDMIECPTCGSSETALGYTECIAAWNVANPLGWGEQ